MPETVIFDHYEVLRRDDGSLYELGRGAMGITYKAFDTNLRVPVALKVINTAALNNEVARQRFVSEARSAAKLRHRHVASVFHLGAGGDTYFYAMEFIDGETVEALIKRQGPLKPALALRIALHVARALNAAHQHGLVHRDIKPSNLMLVKEDDELVVKVIDFGLAKTIHAEGEEDPATLSMSGFVGTPHFASPEQLEDGQIDIRSDIYSLGATLWYMLAGRTLFSGSMAAVMSQHLTKIPPFEELPGLPEAVLTLLRKMLAKAPADRHQTAADLRQEIESCLTEISSGASGSAVGTIEEESLATLLGKTSLRHDGGTFATGAVIAERYEITQTLGDSNTGRLFVARDHGRDGTMVRLHVLRREFAEDHALYTQLEREVERLVKVQHPNLVRVYGLETVPEGSFLVLEAITGFSLMELLRARRELPVEEVQPLLDQTAKGVDYALDSGLRRLDLALHQIHIHFPGVENGGTFLREPVTQWPAFEVKISPLGITRELAASETWAGGETLIAGAPAHHRTGGADVHLSYIKAFASVTYELLGGSLLPLGAPGISSGRYSPLAPLTESGNDIVRQGLQGGDYRSAIEFAEALRISEASEARRREVPSPYRTTTSPIPPPQDVILSDPHLERPRIPLGFIGGVFSMLALGTVLYLFVRGDASTPETSTSSKAPVTAATPARSATPATRSSPAPQEPKPASPPNPQSLLKAAAAGAEALETGADWQRAIRAWLRVAKDFPESDIGRVRLEMLLQRLLDREEDLNNAELERLRDLITEAAHLDVLAAMMLLGESLRTREPATAFNWYSAAAAKGDAAALTQLGLMLSNGAGIDEPDLPKAVICFQLAADKGHAPAKTALAECYLYGKGVEKDETRAITLLKEAADQGNVRAMNHLGTCYHKGIGVEQDYAEALRHFSNAAERGYGGAIGNLGVLYMNGDGVPPNPRRAVELFEKGAKQNDGYSMFQYARCLESGTGIARNTLQAHTWYRRAAESGYPAAIEWCRKNDVPFDVKGQ